ncbi:MAG: carbon storage regulator CsrA [Actinomycetota bacterium]|jgi:carbon storage regulator|nr:carbon storage regulator CsrA [Actinomycetota bacterium]
MLVLTRKASQAIMLGDDVEISVLAVAGDKVRIGIDAPRAVPVYRKEVWLEIQQEGPRRSAPSADGTSVEGELDRLKQGG